MYVLKSFDLSKAVKRKRECYKCGTKIETIELYDVDGTNEDESKFNERLKKLELDIEEIKNNKDL
jgi:transcriptional regulator NrdR family protein